ncbi:MAG TPA: hypothetical protein VM489_09970 [Burkholderiales bacterium]|nr:hypothetical protein [Burkholderiales bacterium]
MRWLLVAALLGPLSAQAQRVKADMDCRFTGADFVYDCVIRLRPPLEGIAIVVGADMPSMPLAHNVRPVKATPGKAPGEYHARLDLDMTGEWAVKLRLSGAVRDLIVLHFLFTETGVTPRRK